MIFSVAFHLLKNGEKQDDANTNNVRQKAILLLCRMQPSQTLFIRNKCIELCKMPSLAVALTLEQTNRSGPINLVSFMTGLLLGKYLKTNNKYRHAYKIYHEHSFNSTIGTNFFVVTKMHHYPKI